MTLTANVMIYFFIMLLLYTIISKTTQNFFRKSCASCARAESPYGIIPPGLFYRKHRAANNTVSVQGLRIAKISLGKPLLLRFQVRTDKRDLLAIVRIFCPYLLDTALRRLIE